MNLIIYWIMPGDRAQFESLIWIYCYLEHIISKIQIIWWFKIEVYYRRISIEIDRDRFIN